MRVKIRIRNQEKHSSFFLGMIFDPVDRLGRLTIFGGSNSLRASPSPPLQASFEAAARKKNDTYDRIFVYELEPITTIISKLICKIATLRSFIATFSCFGK